MKTAVSLLLAFAALSMQGCTKDPIDIVLPDDNTETPVNADDSAGAFLFYAVFLPATHIVE